MTEAWVSISMDVMGETQLERSFQLAEELAGDLSDPLNDVMDALLESVAAQFDSEGMAAEGARWHPLSDAYSKWKARHFPGFPILVATGVMKRAMLDREAAVHVLPDVAAYEPISDIAGYHQQGAEWWGNAWNHPGPYFHDLPARPMVELTEEWKHDAVDRTFARWLDRMLKEAGLKATGG